MIYLDNAATTKISDEVLQAMMPWLTESYGNPGSIHSIGREAAAAVEKARAQVASPIKAKPENIIFTSGASEANTLAICGLADTLLKSGKNHIITTSVEHSSILNAMKSMFYKGFNITYLPVDEQGEISIDDFNNAFTPQTGLVSVMAVNNETGVKFPIYEIGRECKKRNVLFHTDCVQGYGHIELSVDDAGIDFLTASAHKIHGPKGVGMLYARDRALLNPVIPGGGQEGGLRGGTENVAGIVGFGEAAAQMEAKQEELFLTYLNLQRAFTRKLVDGTVFHSNGGHMIAQKIINIRFDGIDGETLLLALDANGVAVSAGSACSAHKAEPSHVLKAMGLSDEEARASIRVSFSAYNTIEEVREAAMLISDLVKELRFKEA